MWFGGYLGFHGNSTLAITRLCLPTVHSNLHGQVVWWPPTCKSDRCYVGHMVWQPSWIPWQLNVAHNLLMLARSMFKFAWSSGLVPPPSGVLAAM